MLIAVGFMTPLDDVWFSFFMDPLAFGEIEGEDEAELASDDELDEYLALLLLACFVSSSKSLLSSSSSSLLASPVSSSSSSISSSSRCSFLFKSPFSLFVLTLFSSFSSSL